MPRQSSRRPPTTQSSRPSTAADDYAFSIPGTASSSSSPYFTTDNPQPLPAALHAHYANYGYPDDRSTLDGVTEEEEEEESDAEDVFAYLPPTTADIERERELQGQVTGQQVRSPTHFAPHPESPPDTNDSYDHLPQGPDAVRMRTLSSQPSHQQNGATPPYTQNSSQPRSPLAAVDQSSLGAKQMHVALPSPVTMTSPPGPSTAPQNYYSYYFPGRAYDNPYEYQISEIEESIPPSTRASVFTTSTEIRQRTNLNIGIVKRSRGRGKHPERRSTLDSLDKDTNIKSDTGLSKLSHGSLAYSGRSRRMEEGGLDDVDWSTRDGSVKCVSLLCS